MRFSIWDARFASIAGSTLLFTIATSMPEPAHAAGLEDTMSGTINLGRAANALRVQDFIATWQNPANLAVVPTSDLGLELRLLILQACFDRARDNSVQYRTNDPANGLMGSESFENVCDDGTHIPSGNLGFAQAFDTGWGWGVGFFTPALNADTKFGDDTIVTQSTNGIQDAPLTDCRSDRPGPRCESRDAELTVPFPTFEATIGARYAQRRTERTRALDPMRDEVWDIEVDGYWSQTSHVDAFKLHLYDQAPGAAGSTNLVFSSAPNAVAVSVPATISVPHEWRDTFGVRAGGDYNVIARKLSVRLGVSYETRAVPVEYMNIDAWPVAKLGLHAGGTLALDRLRLSIAYAHVFFQPVDLGVGEGRVPEVVSQQQNRAQPVNEGYYQAALDVVSLQANLTF